MAGKMPSVTQEQKTSDDTSEAQPAPKKLSKKARRKRQQRRQLMIFLAIVAVVAVVVAAVLGFNKWRDKRDTKSPEDQRIVAVINGKETEIPPYSTCEIDAKDCGQGKPFELDFGGAEEATLKIPKDVYDHDWSMLKIFQNEGANSEDYFRANEQKEVKISLKSEKKDDSGKASPLTVVEIHSLLVGEDDQGEQAPVATVWSIAPKK